MAVVEIELREGALHLESGLGEKRRGTAHRFGLPHRPEAQRTGRAFARGVIGVDVVVLLERAEQVELERHARVACCHHRVGDELARLVRSVMAIKAHIGARFGVFERGESGRDIRSMGGRQCIMFGQPASARRPMTAFAPDPVRQGELRATLAGRRVGRMAAEARRGGLRIAEAEAVRDLLSAPPAKHGIGAAVRARWRGWFLPGGDFVLPHHRAIALGPAMAGRTGAGGHAFESRIADRNRCRIKHSEAEHREQPHDLWPAIEASDQFRQNSRHPIPPEMPAFPTLRRKRQASKPPGPALVEPRQLCNRVPTPPPGRPITPLSQAWDRDATGKAPFLRLQGVQPDGDWPQLAASADASSVLASASSWTEQPLAIRASASASGCSKSSASSTKLNSALVAPSGPVTM